jgi:hypothetical protein
MISSDVYISTYEEIVRLRLLVVIVCVTVHKSAVLIVRNTDITCEAKLKGFLQQLSASIDCSVVSFRG